MAQVLTAVDGEPVGRVWRVWRVARAEPVGRVGPVARVGSPALLAAEQAGR